ncbi:hypothetical protein CA264_11245 [Pontibacter actiniarum]|uniref:Uncharacterized protein n=2 Tax=Pontibacter actiniarum TaxID=323450 RepID=A0A1X9YSU9_9BACT|nr:hypothetical protein CA264_11245 [Pontibacter actiniarum]
MGKAVDIVETKEMTTTTIILVLSLIFAAEALAGECAPVSLERSYQSADFVILAKVGYVKDSLLKKSRYMNV